MRNASVQPGELMKKQRAPKDTALLGHFPRGSSSRPASRQHGVEGCCHCMEWKNSWLSELPLMCGWFSA